MPRIQTTLTVRIALWGLRFYLIILLTLILIKFVREFQARRLQSPEGPSVRSEESLGATAGLSSSADTRVRLGAAAGLPSSAEVRVGKPSVVLTQEAECPDDLVRNNFRVSMPPACPVDAYDLCYNNASSEELTFPCFPAAAKPPLESGEK